MGCYSYSHPFSLYLYAMDIESLNIHFNTLLEHYKKDKNSFSNRFQQDIFPEELRDICIIIKKRYRKLKQNLNKHTTEIEDLVFTENNELLNTQGVSILTPIVIEKNNSINNLSLENYLIQTPPFQDNKLRGQLNNHLINVCSNPLLISSCNSLLSKIKIIAIDTKKRRKPYDDLVVLKIIDQVSFR